MKFSISGLACAAFFSIGVLPVEAQVIDEVTFAQIRESVVLICGKFANEGSSTSMAVDGAVELELGRIAKLLAGAGMEGLGSFDTEAYAGVLREELGSELKDIRACRLKVWEGLFQPTAIGSSSQALDTSAAAEEFASRSSLFECKESQFFEMCIDSSNISGKFAAVAVTLQNISGGPSKVCTGVPSAYSFSQNGEKSDHPHLGGCRRIADGGIENYDFLFEFENEVGRSFDLTILLSNPSSQFTFRDLE